MSDANEAARREALDAIINSVPRWHVPNWCDWCGCTHDDEDERQACAEAVVSGDVTVTPPPGWTMDGEG